MRETKLDPRLLRVLSDFCSYRPVGYIVGNAIRINIFTDYIFYIKTVFTL